MPKSNTTNVARVKCQLLRSELDFVAALRVKTPLNVRHTIDILAGPNGKELVIIREDSQNLLLSRVPIVEGDVTGIAARVDFQSMRSLLPAIPPQIVSVSTGKGYLELRNPGKYRFGNLTTKKIKLDTLPSTSGGTQVRVGAVRKLIKQALRFAADVHTIPDGVFLEAANDELTIFALDRIRAFTASVHDYCEGGTFSCFVPRSSASALGSISPCDDDFVTFLQTGSDLIVECPPRIIVMAQPPVKQPAPKYFKPGWTTDTITVEVEAAELTQQLRMATKQGAKEKCFFTGAGSTLTMKTVNSDGEETAEVEFNAKLSKDIAFVLPGYSMLDFTRLVKGTLTFYVSPDLEQPVVMASESNARCAMMQWI